MQTCGTAIMQFHPAFQTKTGLLGKTAQVSLYSAQKADSPPGISLLPHYLQASSAPCDTEQCPSVDAAGTAMPQERSLAGPDFIISVSTVYSC